MNRKLDYSSVWKTTQSQLNAHREGVGAISGLFLFLPDWIARLFAGQPDLQGATTPAQMLLAFQSFYLETGRCCCPRACWASLVRLRSMCF